MSRGTGKKPGILKSEEKTFSTLYSIGIIVDILIKYLASSKRGSIKSLSLFKLKLCLFYLQVGMLSALLKLAQEKH